MEWQKGEPSEKKKRFLREEKAEKEMTGATAERKTKNKNKTVVSLVFSISELNDRTRSLKASYPLCYVNKSAVKHIDYLCLFGFFRTGLGERY